MNVLAIRRFTILIMAALLVAACPASSRAEERSHEDLWEEVWNLRRSGEYATAAALADTLVAMRESAEDVPTHDVESARWLARTCLTASALTDAGQRELSLTDSLMAVLEGMEDHKAGIAMAKEHLEIRRRLLGSDHPDVAWSLNALGAHLMDSGDPASSIVVRREAVDISLASWGDSHPFTASYVSDLAHAQSRTGDFATAADTYGHAAEIYERAHGPGGASAGGETNQQMFMLFRVGRYGEVKALGELALERWSDLPDVVGDTYTILGFNAVDSGDYAGAEAYSRRSLEIKEAAFGPDHDLTARAMRDLATQVYRRGDLVAAEAIARTALERIEAIWGRRNTSTALAIQVLSGIHTARGDHARAEDEAREVLDIYREERGGDHMDVAACLSWLAGIVGDAGDYERSAAYREDALEMARSVLGEDSPRISSYLINLSREYIYLERYADAELLLREAVEIDRSGSGSLGVVGARRLMYLADCRRHLGDLDEAEALYRECLSMERGLLGAEHQRLAVTQMGLGTVLHSRGNYEEAEEILNEAARVHDVARLRIGKGIERASYGESSPYAWLALSQLALGKWDRAWQSVERSSGRALADLLTGADVSFLSPREKAREDSLRTRMTELERKVATLTRNSVSDSTALHELSAGRGELADAEAAWSSFRYEMAQLYPESEGRVLTLEEVQEALDPETALVGWLDVERFDDVTESWGYVVRTNGPVAWVRLAGTGSDSPVPGAAGTAVRDLIADPVSHPMALAREARSLWGARFAPMARALEEAKNLVVIPSGPMLGVPIEALVLDDGRFVVEVFEVSYSPSGTVFARLGGGALAQASPSGSLLVGDPPFADAHAAAMASEPASPWDILAMGEGLNPDASLLRSAVAGDVDALAGLPRLRGTRAEVLLLDEIAGDATLLLGTDASEQSFAAMAESGELSEYGSLHIATHALVDDEHSGRSSLVLSQVGLPDAVDAAMAGQRVYDGLLTAEEIVSECRLNADLVTLSACETGLGTKFVGEGYVGFAHAFLQAGARSLVVSLWKVDDRATALLMQRFYENRFGQYSDVRRGRTAEPLAKAEALAEAKAWLRAYEDESGARPYEHPYYWSAFVLIGGR